jgi:hypothetical protein
MYKALNEAQRTMVDEKIREYAEKYGSAPQGVTCANRTSAGSRKIELRCAKNQGIYPDYDIELALTRYPVLKWQYQPVNLSKTHLYIS